MATVRSVQVAVASFAKTEVQLSKYISNFSFLKTGFSHRHKTPGSRHTHTACRANSLRPHALYRGACRGYLAVARRVLVNGFNFGKIEVRFCLKNLNFSISVNGQGHLHKKPQSQLSHTACRTGSGTPRAL